MPRDAMAFVACHAIPRHGMSPCHGPRSLGESTPVAPPGTQSAPSRAGSASASFDGVSEAGGDDAAGDEPSPVPTAKRQRRGSRGSNNSGGGPGSGSKGGLSDSVPRILTWAKLNKGRAERLLSEVANATPTEFKGFRLRGHIAEHIDTLEDRAKSLEGKELPVEARELPAELKMFGQVVRGFKD